MINLKWEPKNLEEVMREVEEIERSKKRKIDPEIKPLVIQLRRWGIDTQFSCQGHKRLLPFPWIMISSKDVYKFHFLSGLFNLQNRPMLSEIQWGTITYTYPSEISIRVLPIKIGHDKPPSLGDLQQLAIDFSKFLERLQELPRPKQVSKLLSFSF